MKTVLNAAQTSTALAFSPQMPIDPRAGSFLGECTPVPPGVQIIDSEHFKLSFFAPSAQSVIISRMREDISLDKDENGLWTTVLPIQSGGLQPLFFKVDGVSVLNPMAPVGFGSSCAVNMADLPQKSKSFYHLKNVPHGTVSQEFYYSEITKRHESCLVYTPPCYKNGGLAYPVLYLQHGHGENEHCWVQQGKINFIMDNLIAEGLAEPCIIVMNNGMVQKETANGNVIDFNLLCPLLISDCIPFISSAYRVKPGKENRAMAGLSMGSLQTSMITLSNPELFAWAGVFSGFMRPLKGLDSGTAHLKQLDSPEYFKKNYKLFFRAMGKQDFFKEIFEQDTEMLKEKGLTPKTCGMLKENWYDGGHDWNVWRECAKDFLQLIFK